MRVGTAPEWLGRILVLIYAIFTVSALARSTVQLLRDAAAAPFAYWLSFMAAMVYLLATISLALRTPLMRRVAWFAVSFELVGVLTIGALSIQSPELFPRATVWSQFGSGYGFVPLVLPFLGLWWLRSSSTAPANAVAASEMSENSPAAPVA